MQVGEKPLSAYESATNWSCEVRDNCTWIIWKL